MISVYWSPENAKSGREEFIYLNEEDIMYLKEKKIKIIPWTVNSYSDIANVLKFDIDGIISDYPDRVIKLKKLE